MKETTPTISPMIDRDLTSTIWGEELRRQEQQSKPNERGIKETSIAGIDIITILLRALKMMNLRTSRVMVGLVQEVGIHINNTGLSNLGPMKTIHSSKI